MRLIRVDVCQPKLENKDSLHSILFPFHEFISVYGLLPVHKKNKVRFGRRLHEICNHMTENIYDFIIHASPKKGLSIFGS